jgi:hypothetical protein
MGLNIIVSSTNTQVDALVRSSASYREADGQWTTAVTDLSTTELKTFLRTAALTQMFTVAEVVDLKRVRRQRKNKGYTQAAHDRKIAKEKSRQNGAGGEQPPT